MLSSVKGDSMITDYLKDYIHIMHKGIRLKNDKRIMSIFADGWYIENLRIICENYIRSAILCIAAYYVLMEWIIRSGAIGAEIFDLQVSRGVAIIAVVFAVCAIAYLFTTSVDLHQLHTETQRIQISNISYSTKNIVERVYKELTHKFICFKLITGVVVFGSLSACDFLGVSELRPIVLIYAVVFVILAVAILLDKAYKGSKPLIQIPFNLSEEAGHLIVESSNGEINDFDGDFDANLLEGHVFLIRDKYGAVVEYELNELNSITFKAGEHRVVCQCGRNQGIHVISIN